MRSTWANSKGRDPPSPGFIAGTTVLASVIIGLREFDFLLFGGAGAVASHDFRLFIGGSIVAGSDGVADADVGGLEAGDELDEAEDPGGADVGEKEAGREG